MASTSDSWMKEYKEAVKLADDIRTNALDKPPIQELHQFLEFQLLRQWAPVFSELPLGPQRKQQSSSSLQFSLMGPKLYVNTTQKVDEDVSVGSEAFCRIAPAVPIIANIIIGENVFAVLSLATGGRLQFSTYDKYLNGLERDEKILEVEGTVTTQPVLEHVGISTWPGRLILTDHALYLEAHRFVSYDKPEIYDLSDDLK